MLRIVLIGVLAFLAGCSPVKPTIMNPAYQSPGPDKFQLSIERGKWYGTNWVKLGIFIDNHIAGYLGGGQAMTFYVPAGRHIVGVQSITKDRPDMVDSAIVVDVSASSQPILKADISAGGYGGWRIRKE